MLKNKKVQGGLQLLISVLLISWLLWQAGPQDVAKTLLNLDLAWYIPAFFLFLTNLFLRSLRWYTLLKQLNDHPSYLHLVYLYFIGFFANNFILSGFGGDVIKVVSLRQTYGRGAEALSSVLMDRLTGLFGSSLVALTALILHRVYPMTDVILPPTLLTAVAIISFGIPSSFFLMRWGKPIPWLVQRIPAITRLPKFNKLEELADTVQQYPLSALLKALLISLPFTLVLIVIQFSIARALGINLPLSVFSLIVPIISIVNLIPISFNGLGTRDLLYQFLFIPLGVPQVTAIAMSLAFYFLRFGAGLIGGLLYAFKSSLSVLQAPNAKKTP
ncbi:MAG: flippase-like domain-containing protein [Chloroflexi bacterium]|nr:flippase-like domain-containing protein [Chloroflexota bacterium]